ncbi:hypothetical protein SAMN04488109_6313 [Chryseolinea serpens]|uniref:Uncharacterized protein n=1 Tax=Chryseolinea serpens TaxID=947013 RepID=A0A1M5XB38_9BACT|nr:hypothetical protein [Chryseolinea serpens]SHH96778.1 hypothetical protein SAMN04488109_6313 [Chryseolinea serpens]
MMSDSRRKNIHRPLFKIALYCSWPAFLFFEIGGYVVAIFWVAVFVLLIRQDRRKAWRLLFFSPWIIIPLFHFTAGTIGYFSGTAALGGVGYPGPGFFNLDRQYRAWHSTSGCVQYGNEPLTDGPRNAAIYLWTNLCGYQRDVYQGYYPDERKTQQLLNQQGKMVDVHQTERGIDFLLDGKKYQIRNQDHRAMPLPDSCRSGRVVVVGDELLIFKSDTSPIQTYLADHKTGLIFACYWGSFF